MIGFQMCCTMKYSSSVLPALVFPPPPISSRSCPTEKARPVPVTMPSHTSGSSRRLVKASHKPSSISRFIALSFSGRFMVIVAIRPRTSYSTSAIAFLSFRARSLAVT